MLVILVRRFGTLAIAGGVVGGNNRVRQYSLLPHLIASGLCTVNRMNRLALFVKSAGVLLLITALAKIFTGLAGHTGILSKPDPILIIPFRAELLVVGALEIIVAAVCFFTKRIQLQLGLIAWLATSFVAYRCGLLLLNIEYCKCLGNLPDALHLSTHTTNIITSSILIYLLLGSYCGLIGKWILNSRRS
jgi:hypothetical protein